MNKEMVQAILSPQPPFLKSQYHVKNIGIFGSFAWRKIFKIFRSLAKYLAAKLEFLF